MGKEKKKSASRKIFDWAISGVLWDVFKVFANLVWSAIVACVLNRQSDISRLISDMNIPIIVALFIMFAGTLSITWGVGCSIVWIYKKVNPRINQNKKQEIISDRRKEKTIDIEIKEYHYPSYLQATKVGLLIQNNSGKDIFPRVKIIGKMKRTEYAYGNKFSTSFLLPKTNRIINSDTPIENNNCGEIILVVVERNENVSLLLSRSHNLLKSFYGTRIGKYKVDRVRWDFTFEIFGNIGSEQFKNGVFSTSIESYMRDGDVFVQIGETKASPETHELGT
jgi:hypothetical protein